MARPRGRPLVFAPHGASAGAPLSPPPMELEMDETRSTAPQVTRDALQRALSLCERALDLLAAEPGRSANLETVLVTVEALKSELDAVSDDVAGSSRD